MNSYLQFIKTQLKPVGFGFSLLFFSSFGQTFMISLYVPYLMKDLRLSEGGFGSIYAIATIASAVLLFKFGHRIDTKPLRPYTKKTILLLSASCLILGIAVHPIMAALALLGLRFAGQGLMSHISQTVMAKHFDHDRGKALSLSSMGYSVGELIFPVLITAIIASLGWRVALGFSGLLLVACMLPIIHALPLETYGNLLENEITDCPPGSGSSPAILPAAPQASIMKATADKPLFYTLVKTPYFWIFAPSTFILSFTMTGLFFYQLLLAETRGWSIKWYAIAFSGYALTRFLTSLLGGPLVDKLGARILFPLYLIPMTIGTVILGISASATAAQIYLVLVGITMGTSGIVSGAMLAETFEREKLGSVRSIISAIGVGGAALGSLAFGKILDAGISFDHLILGAAAMLALGIVNNLRLWFLPIHRTLALN